MFFKRNKEKERKEKRKEKNKKEKKRKEKKKERCGPYQNILFRSQLNCTNATLNDCVFRHRGLCKKRSYF